MGKNKLKKFAEMEAFDHVFQCSAQELEERDYRKLGDRKHALAGHWHEVFHNDHPIVLELGCGHGEYTVGLAARYPDKNFLGIDIKGARMWSGAKQAKAEGLTTAAFLRINIEMLPYFFTQDEVSEIWITFPDPQMKKATKRLTSTFFLERYRLVLRDGGLIHLKTDSPFLYTYTREMLKASDIQPNADTADLYAGPALIDLDIRTHYEQQWLDRGLTIKYLQWPLFHAANLVEPDIEIEPDTYKSYGRGTLN